MMMLSELQTPCGVLKCSDQSNNTIQFSSIQIEKQYATAVYDEIISDWVQVEPEHQSTITIHTSALNVEEIYILRLYGDYEYQYGASDENAIANVISHNGYSLSLGAFDPNDAEKDRQCVPVYNGSVRIGLKPPEHYDISKFQGYLLSVLPDWSGYSFKIIDHSLSEVLFRIAWIKHNDELVAEIDHYENAVTLITTF